MLLQRYRSRISLKKSQINTGASTGASTFRGKEKKDKFLRKMSKSKSGLKKNKFKNSHKSVNHLN